MDKRIILLTGPPGAGKGTQATQVVSGLEGWRTFSVGEILRNTANPAARELMKEGKLLPAQQVVGLVGEEIASHPESVIVDGFPRRVDQAEAFDSLAQEKGFPLPFVLFLNIDHDESWRRLSQRGREDDGREVWEQRWEEYQTRTLAAVDYYRAANRLYEVDGRGEISEVAARIRAVLDAA